MATTRKRGLGRGLDALLTGLDTASPKAAPESELRYLPLDQIQRGKYQPRVDMHTESLEDLANSIRAQGVVQPVVVRGLGGGAGYELIAGERRWRAAQLAGLEQIPALVKDVPDKAAIAMALIENIQRENLNPLEEAMALQRLIDEFDMTHQAAAEAVGRSRAAVSNLLRLQELNQEVKQLLGAGELDMGRARPLLALSGKAQIEAARRVIAKGLSARDTERLVRQWLAPKSTHHGEAKSPDPNIRDLEASLSETLGAKVHIQHGAQGKGKLLIYYNSLDELDGILAHIK